MMKIRMEVARVKMKKKSEEEPELKIYDVASQYQKGNFTSFFLMLELGLLENFYQNDKSGFNVLHHAVSYN